MDYDRSLLAVSPCLLGAAGQRRVDTEPILLILVTSDRGRRSKRGRPNGSESEEKDRGVRRDSGGDRLRGAVDLLSVPEASRLR
jgi:hypothetical protein